MRVPRSIAWTLILLTLFTAGLLRQFHDQTPRSPYVPTFVGSLLFAAIFILLLVSAREWRQGASPGPGIRLGSLTPLILMLLIEKWISLSFYNPVFFALSPLDAPDAYLDAWYRGFAGVGLILVCLLVGSFSRPAWVRTLEWARLSRWLPAVAWLVVPAAGSYLVLYLLGYVIGGRLTLAWPAFDSLLVWIIVSQAVLAFAEELYYRGLLMSELQRLSPRLGLRRRAMRRWFALLATAIVFGMEHLAVSTSWENMGRQMIFTVSLGVLLGLLAMITRNLHFAAGAHAWINWILLGAAPRFVDGEGRSLLPAGTYIGIFLILTFCIAAVLSRMSRRSASRVHTLSPG